MIIESIVALKNKITDLYSGSFTASLVKKGSGSIKNEWVDSCSSKVFVDQEQYDNASTSVFGKMVNSIVKFVTKINLKKAVNNSFFVDVALNILRNAATVNSAFWGSLILMFSLVNAGLIVFEYGMVFGLIWRIVSAVIGIGLIFLNRSIILMFKNSVFTAFAEKIIGEEIRFDAVTEMSDKAHHPLVYGLVFGAVMGASGMFVSTLYIIAAFISLIGILLVLMNCTLGVFALAVLSPFMPTMVCAGLAVLTFVSFLIAVVTKRMKFRTLGAVDLIVMFFAAVATFYAVTSLAQMMSVRVLLLYLAFISMYFVIINTINTRRKLHLLVVSFLFSGGVVALYGVYQKYFGNIEGTVWLDLEMFGDIGNRVYSTFGNPNVLGEYLLLIIPLSATLLWSDKGIWNKLFALGIFAVACFCMILTQSRGCWLALLGAAVVFIMFVERRFLVLFVIGLLAAPFILPTSIIERFVSIGNVADSSTSYRVYIWLGTLNMLKDFGIYGLGLGSDAYNKIYPFYSYSSIVAPHAHNIYLQLLCEMGVVGLGAILTMLTVLFRKLIKCFSKQEKNFEGVLAVAVLAALIGFMIQGAFDYVWYNYRVVLIFWMFIALGVATVNMSKFEEGHG